MPNSGKIHGAHPHQDRHLGAQRHRTATLSSAALAVCFPVRMEILKPVPVAGCERAQSGWRCSYRGAKQRAFV